MTKTAKLRKPSDHDIRQSINIKLDATVWYRLKMNALRNHMTLQDRLTRMIENELSLEGD